MVKNSIQVFGRIKRSNKASYLRHYDIRKGKESKQEVIFTTDSSGEYGIYRNSKHKFRFNQIFDQDTIQTVVFDTVAKPVIDSVLEGYNGTIFAYGQTGSGKTFTMTGSAEYQHRGIIPRTIQYIFEHVESSTDVLYSIYISYLEIYNEVGYDLLNPKHRASSLEDLPRVTLLEDAKGQTHLRNLGVISVASEREAMCLLFLGDTNRAIAETPMNMYSSRSHCIFTVHVAATMPDGGRVRRSKLHLVDLAGSERIHKTSISGSMLVDAKQINLSLHYLEQVIVALSDSKRSHVPYRNSMMTTVLKDSLGGNCLTAMLATMSIDPRNFEETVSTCKFAQRVALITSEAFINEDEDPYMRINELKLEVDNLKKELSLFKDPDNQLQYKGKKELAHEQRRECEKEVTRFIKGTTNQIRVDGNLHKVYECFNIFKRIISSKNIVVDNDQTSNKSDINLYKDQIKEKDNHISEFRFGTDILFQDFIQQLNVIPAVLVNMLNNEKKEPSSPEENFAPRMRSNVTMAGGMSNKKKPLAQKEVFELFLRQDRNENEVTKCGNALRLKMQAAKKSADKIQSSKENIITLKKKLRENINNKPDVTNKLMSQLKSHQEIYRENILELYNLKKEAAHLSHGFQQAKRRVMRRFREWWEGYKKSTNSYEQYSTNMTQSESSSTMFSPKSPTDYFNWDPEISSCNFDQPALQSVCNVDSFPSVFDSESMEQFSDFKFDSTVMNQFKENNFAERSHNEVPLQYPNQNYNGQGDRVNFHPSQMQNYPPMQRCDGNYACDQMKNFPNDNPPRQPIHRVGCDPNNQLMMPNSVCDMNQQYYRQPSPAQSFMPSSRNSFNCYEIDPKAQPYPGTGFNQFPEAYQQNFMNYDLPEKLPNYQKQTGYYGYAPPPPPPAYINKPPNSIPPEIIYRPNFPNPPQMPREPYDSRRSAQYVDIVIKPGGSNNYYPNINSQPNSRGSIGTNNQWNEDPRNVQVPNETEVHSSPPNSPRSLQEPNYAVANHQFPNNPQNVCNSQSYTYVSTEPEVSNANFKSCNASVPNIQQSQSKKSTDEVALENIPLTGDPEVDEEILSFYRSKNNVIKQISQ